VFIRGSAAIGLLALSPARAFAQATGSRLIRHRFTPLVGESFRMTGGGHNIKVVLTKVGDLTPVLRAHDPNRFALLFRIPDGRQPTPGIRSFRHPAVGTVDLFVSPVDRGAKALHYEAVINRSRT
jgi:hypothetical protein